MATWKNLPVSVSVAAAAVAVVGAGFWWFSSSAAAEEDEPVLDLSDTVELMAQILENLRVTAAQHVRAADNIKEQLVASGQSMSHEDIMTTIILPHFKNAFQTMQAQLLEVILAVFFPPKKTNFKNVYVYQEYDIDEEELEESVEYHLKNSEAPKLAEVVSKLKLLCQQFTGDENDAETSSAAQGSRSQGVQRRDLSAEELLEVLEDFGEKTVSDVESFTGTFVATYGVPETDEMKLRFHEQLSAISER